jgi:hypothetical protein
MANCRIRMMGHVYVIVNDELLAESGSDLDNKPELVILVLERML